LPGSEGVGREGERGGERDCSRGKGGEMTQTLYAHMNKRNFKKEEESKVFFLNCVQYF
jgi:hypothetical protein